MDPYYSVIVVCYQAGVKLKNTVDSILMQTDGDFEIIVKDGCSTDGSLVLLPRDERIRVIRKKDTGIYDAMNQAVEEVRGRYVIFLNCGDYFNSKLVLESMRHGIRYHKEVDENTLAIFYGNIYDRPTKTIVTSNPKITTFGCYRNLPCHQCCFYDVRLIRPDLIRQRGRQETYNVKYRVRADYEHFLWCYFKVRVKTVYIGLNVTAYEGNGFSEKKENRALSRKEHWEITGLYMSKTRRFIYYMLMMISLAPLRRRMAKNKVIAAFYQKLKRIFYMAHT